MFLVYVVLCLIVFGCQYQCSWLPGKTRLWNDLLCVEWDVKLYSLAVTQPLTFQDQSLSGDDRTYSIIWQPSDIEAVWSQKLTTSVLTTVQLCQQWSYYMSDHSVCQDTSHGIVKDAVMNWYLHSMDMMWAIFLQPQSPHGVKGILMLTYWLPI